ncbi:MAG: UDP-3-O-(3-hydroxymyristoyl)glucosamine N-acyltransferase [Planctomycetia bacterium]|nr:UDP-3-O-(3-hydroxymyristoyl)glucosamine N-acyltransferase [Planctomycetia bacterium]
MKKTLLEIARQANAQLLGDGSVEIRRATPFIEAQEGDITLLDSTKKLFMIARTRASAVLIPTACEKMPDEETLLKHNPRNIPLLLAPDVIQTFANIVSIFKKPVSPMPKGIHPRAVVDESASIGADCSISAGVFIGPNVQIGDRVTIYPNVCILEGAQIGDDTVIFPNATIYEQSQIGKRCILHSSSVIGAYGFGYSTHDGEHHLAPQLGLAILEDDVEIGTNSTVDRGTFGTTRIGAGTKIDNLVAVGHNCQIGRRNLFCAQVGIAGSTTTGENVVCAGQAGIADHVTLANNVTIAAQAGVAGSISEPGTYLGTPAEDIREMRRQFITMKQLPLYWRTLKKMAQDKDAQKDAQKEVEVK